MTPKPSRKKMKPEIGWVIVDKKGRRIYEFLEKKKDAKEEMKLAFEKGDRIAKVKIVEV